MSDNISNVFNLKSLCRFISFTILRFFIHPFNFIKLKV
ncbi:CLUMA_CG016591, isoform A, partial [Clunio marinus]